MVVFFYIKYLFRNRCGIMNIMKNNGRKYYLNEDITSSEVRSIVNSKLDDFLRQREFEKRVNEISAKVLEKFISQLFNKRQMWTSNLKNG